MRAGSIGTVEISPTDPLSVLWTRIQELHDYPAETTRLVHMGKVLTLAKDGDAPASNLAFERDNEIIEKNKPENIEN